MIGVNITFFTWRIYAGLQLSIHIIISNGALESPICQSCFDSSNLAGVECVYKKGCEPNGYVPLKSPREEAPDYAFNVYSKRDCEGTSYECCYKMWFYFGVKSESAQGKLVQFNIMGAHARLYTEGMSPVYLAIPGDQEWQRIKQKISHFSGESTHGISFKYRMPLEEESTTYFAFTYPFPFEQLQSYLSFAEKHLTRRKDIYFHRECVCYTLEGRPVELITVSSFKNITKIREPRLKYLFPMEDKPRAFIFRNKKIVFISARVHPGETPSSFVLKGFMDYVLTSFDPLGVNLRNNFVFKIIPMLNPDGVAKGHFRADSRGMDLNRVYDEPSLYHHPSIYAARSLILYYHFGREVEVIPNPSLEMDKKGPDLQIIAPSVGSPNEKVVISEESKDSGDAVKKHSITSMHSSNDTFERSSQKTQQENRSIESTSSYLNPFSAINFSKENYGPTSKDPLISDRNPLTRPKDSGLFMYVDLHGHSSKKGVFMFGNYFKDPADLVECMLFPKIMALNSENFDFSACSFSERNMSLKDRSSELSKEGCGRVMAMKLTGSVRCYTLECNYNTGRTVTELPPRAVVDRRLSIPVVPKVPQPPYQYTPESFEEVGKALAISLLDLKGCNPWSRIPYSEYRTLDGIRRWLKLHCLPEQEFINKRNSKLVK